MPQLTICICTLDRAADLQRCFTALLLNKGLQFVEILVVNNGSGEESRSVVDEYASRLPVRYIRHDKPTVGEVLNRAWQESASEWLAYIDDDSIVYPTWLESILKAIPEVGPDCFAMAGNVDMGPHPPVLPDWCGPNLAAAAYSNIDFGEQDRFLDFPGALGNNLVIRKSLLERHGGFSRELRTYWESHIFYLGFWAGGNCFFNAGMRVAHTPSQNRLTKEWALNKFRNSGRDYQRMLGSLHHFPQCPARYSVILTLPITFLKLLAGYLTGSPRRIMTFRAMLNFEMGRFEQLLLGKKSIEYSTFGKTHRTGSG
jgi:glycosyltransferase involved in cell wall biosynthesis